MGFGVSIANRLAWDGLADSGARAADGLYQFSLAATANGKPVSAEALSVGRVDGVTRGSDGTNLNVGRLGAKTLADIKRIM